MESASARAGSERPFYALHAEAYDLLITDPAGPWVDAVHETLAGFALSPASILDAGCGTGRHAAGLIARGHRVDLVDASAALLTQAASRCPTARTTLADLCTMEVRPAYDAVTCRGVLNDMTTDEERASAVRSLAGSLVPDGVLLLDVRERRGSRQRADGVTRSRQVDLAAGGRLTFAGRTTWSRGLLHVEETYELTRPAAPAQRSRYRFTMRPWTEPELRAALRECGLRIVRVAAGAGRRTPDRLFVVARQLSSSG
ncbi:methyltransferase domain-containing protein [Actinoplanes sp. NPDC026623]|uniref:class I SAM-dependent methyltransferase n=1 Tax=Actinoplanes sp. NPDC026623 TaxID=3155610 RepID=UPI0033F5C34E